MPIGFEPLARRTCKERKIFTQTPNWVTVRLSALVHFGAMQLKQCNNYHLNERPEELGWQDFKKYLGTKLEISPNLQNVPMCLKCCQSKKIGLSQVQYRLNIGRGHLLPGPNIEIIWKNDPSNKWTKDAQYVNFWSQNIVKAKNVSLV